MKKLMTTLCLILLSFNACSGKQGNQNEVELPPPANINEAIAQSRTIVEALLTEYPGLSVSVGLGDSVIWSEGFGFADVFKETTMEADHSLRYYSLSKSLCGMALMKLMAEGKLDIEQSVTNYLPDLPAHYRDVKVKHLISHTAGIRHYKKGEWMRLSKNDCRDVQSALEVFVNDPLENTPGITYSYSSFGHVLLSGVIEAVSGSTFMGFLNTELLKPHAIGRIKIDQSQEIVNEAGYYDKWRARKKSGKVAEAVNNSCKFGGGGLVGRASDLVAVHLKMLNHEIVPEQFTRQYYQSLKNTDGEDLGYAFGIGSNTSKTGKPYNAHTGSGRGANCILIVYPESKLVVVVLGNLESNLMNAQTGKIADPFLRIGE